MGIFSVPPLNVSVSVSYPPPVFEEFLLVADTLTLLGHPFHFPFLPGNGRSLVPKTLHQPFPSWAVPVAGPASSISCLLPLVPEYNDRISAERTVPYEGTNISFLYEFFVKNNPRTRKADESLPASLKLSLFLDSEHFRSGLCP